MVIKMDISIKESIINNIKNDDKNSIISLINESIKENDEIVLPGLGVLLSLFWDSLDINDQEKIANIILDKVKTSK